MGLGHQCCAHQSTGKNQTLVWPDLSIVVIANDKAANKFRSFLRFHFDQADTRIHVVKSNVKRYGIPMFYVNHTGAQTELIFDGGSLVVSPNGNIHDEMPYFEEKIKVYDLDEVVEGKENCPQPTPIARTL